jgi:hypothetical protein
MTATAMLAELEPATATEALLAAQMVGTERAAMRFLARAMLPGQTTEAIDANVTRSVRLMRLFNEQIETMSKLKGKSGQQRVVVEHVNVEAGGQAIVGTVIPRGASGGDLGESRCASIAGLVAKRQSARQHDHCSAMWCQDAASHGVPSPSNAERALPDARRFEHWSENGGGVGA